VKVNVKNRLTRSRPVILHQAETGFSIPLLASYFTPLTKGIADQRIVLRSHVEAVDKMPFRQQQQVQRRLGSDILDNQQLFILEYLL